MPIYDGLLTRMSGAYLVANGEYLGDPSTRSYYSKVGPSPVIKDGSVYRMWPEMVSLPPTFGGPTSYSGQTGSFDSDTVTGYMTSSDGTTWTWYDTNSDGEPNRVIHPNCATNPAGGSTAWMRGEASVGTVLYDSTAGLWKAWGHGGNNTGPRAMWYATASAPEGPWTFQNNGQPILQRDTGAGSFETAFIADARVIRLSATSYVMLYGGHKVTVDRPQVGWATSSDGVTWTKNSSTVPVFGYGASGAWDEEAIYPAGLVYDGTTYHLWYAGCPLGSTTLGTGLGYASSTNGTTWTRGTNNPVLGLSASGLDSASLGDTVCAYLDGTVFRVNYAGSKTTPNGGSGTFRGRLEATLSTVSGGATTSPNGFTSKPGAARARLGRFYLGGAALLTSTPPPPYTGSATLPTLLVEIAFGAPTDPPTWTDVTAYVEGFSVRRGRQTALDQMQTGTATIRLSNLDRRFDPSYTGSPYYPNLKRRRRVRIQAVWDGVTYPVFSGYIDRVPQSYGSFQDAFVDLPCVDGFAVLAAKKLNTTFPEQLSGARISAVAAAAYWTSGEHWRVGDSTWGVVGTMVVAPAGLRDLDAGDVLLDAATLQNTAALTHLQAVQTTENGLVFIARDGTLTFRSRYTRINPVSVATFGDRPDSGELPVTAIDVTDTFPIYNEAIVQRQNGVPQTALDTASRTDYFESTIQLTSLANSDNDCITLANWLLDHYKQPVTPMLTGLLLEPQAAPGTLWPQALGRELGDCVTARQRPVAAPAEVREQMSWLEGIEHVYSVTDGVWQTRFSLSVASASTYQAYYWTVGDPVLSVLGSTTRVF